MNLIGFYLVTGIVVGLVEQVVFYRAELEQPFHPLIHVGMATLTWPYDVLILLGIVKRSR